MQQDQNSLSYPIVLKASAQGTDHERDNMSQQDKLPPSLFLVFGVPFQTGLGILAFVRPAGRLVLLMLARCISLTGQNVVLTGSLIGRSLVESK